MPSGTVAIRSPAIRPPNRHRFRGNTTARKAADFRPLAVAPERNGFHRFSGGGGKTSVLGPRRGALTAEKRVLFNPAKALARAGRPGRQGRWPAGRPDRRENQRHSGSNGSALRGVLHLSNRHRGNTSAGARTGSGWPSSLTGGQRMKTGERLQIRSQRTAADPLARDEPLLSALYSASMRRRTVCTSAPGRALTRLGDRIDIDDVESSPENTIAHAPSRRPTACPENRVRYPWPFTGCALTNRPGD
jgi:hypothetical protein